MESYKKIHLKGSWINQPFFSKKENLALDSIEKFEFKKLCEGQFQAKAFNLNGISVEDANVFRKTYNFIVKNGFKKKRTLNYSFGDEFYEIKFKKDSIKIIFIKNKNNKQTLLTEKFNGF